MSLFVSVMWSKSGDWRKKRYRKRAVESRTEKGSEVNESKSMLRKKGGDGYDNSHRINFHQNNSRGESSRFFFFFMQFLFLKNLLHRLFQVGWIDLMFVCCLLYWPSGNYSRRQGRCWDCWVYMATCNKAQATTRRHEEEACAYTILCVVNQGGWLGRLIGWANTTCATTCVQGNNPLHEIRLPTAQYFKMISSERREENKSKKKPDMNNGKKEGVREWGNRVVGW